VAVVPGLTNHVAKVQWTRPVACAFVSEVMALSRRAAEQAPGWARFPYNREAT